MRTKYNCAGVSRSNGTFTFRATNREPAVYPSFLKYSGHTDITIVPLQEPMTKDQARKWLAGLQEFQDPEIQACLRGKEEEPKAPKKRKAAAPTIVPTVSSVRERALKATDDVLLDMLVDDEADVDVAQALGRPIAKYLEEMQ